MLKIRYARTRALLLVAGISVSGCSRTTHDSASVIALPYPISELHNIKLGMSVGELTQMRPWLVSVGEYNDAYRETVGEYSITYVFPMRYNTYASLVTDGLAAVIASTPLPEADTGKVSLVAKALETVHGPAKCGSSEPSGQSVVWMIKQSADSVSFVRAALIRMRYSFGVDSINQSLGVQWIHKTMLSEPWHWVDCPQ